uniref:Uncharacterized protein n=1 Tax=Oryza brachyantha TaxID=4533 RepID=J3L9W0_ORYBR
MKEFHPKISKCLNCFLNICEFSGIYSNLIQNLLRTPNHFGPNYSEIPKKIPIFWIRRRTHFFFTASETANTDPDSIADSSHKAHSIES